MEGSRCSPHVSFQALTYSLAEAHGNLRPAPRQETPKTCCMASPSVSLGKEMEVEWSKTAKGKVRVNGLRLRVLTGGDSGSGP